MNEEIKIMCLTIKQYTEGQKLTCSLFEMTDNRYSCKDRLHFNHYSFESIEDGIKNFKKTLAKKPQLTRIRIDKCFTTKQLFQDVDITLCFVNNKLEAQYSDVTCGSGKRSRGNVTLKKMIMPLLEFVEINYKDLQLQLNEAYDKYGDEVLDEYIKEKTEKIAKHQKELAAVTKLKKELVRK